MKKRIVYLSFLCTLAASNMWLTSCNNSNESNLSDSQYLESSIINNSSELISSDDNKIEVQDVLNLLGEKINYLTNIDNYTKGFTAIVTGEGKSDVTILDDKSDYGNYNADGNQWTSESEKEEFKNAILDEYKSYSNYTSNYKNKIAFNLENKEGFFVVNNNYSGEEYGYSYLYTKENNDYCFYDINELEKYTTGEEYYKEVFSNYIDSIQEIDYIEGNTNLSLFINYLKQSYQEYYENVDVLVSADMNKEDNYYILTITINIIDEETGVNANEIINFTFNDEYLNVDYETDYKYEQNYKICDKDDSGYFLIQNQYTYKNTYQFLMEYDDNDCPNIDDTIEKFNYEGNVYINVQYNIEGHYVFNSSKDVQYNSEVTQLSFSGSTECFKDDMVWYLDEECTIPFNETTWPSYSFNLYTTLDSLNDDYYFVAHHSFNEAEYLERKENNRLYYYYDIMKKGEEQDFIDFDYAYFNDEKIYSKDDIIFVKGIINYFISIHKD